jgi:hypothetical protein
VSCVSAAISGTWRAAASREGHVHDDNEAGDGQETAHTRGIVEVTEASIKEASSRALQPQVAGALGYANSQGAGDASWRGGGGVLLPWLLRVMCGDPEPGDVTVSTAAKLRACNAVLCAARALVEARPALRDFTRAVAHACLQQASDGDATAILREGCLQILFVCVHGLQKDAAPIIRDAMDVAEVALKVRRTRAFTHASVFVLQVHAEHTWHRQYIMHT